MIAGGRELAEGTSFHIDVIDTWNMTIAPVPGTFVTTRSDKNNYTFEDAQKRVIELPGRPWMALRIVRAKP